MSVWQDHPELVEQLKIHYVEDGWSASAIARALGHGISRNAVIGRVTRMGLPLRGNEAPRISRQYGKKKGDVGFVLPSAGASRSKVKTAPVEPEFASGALVPALVLPDGKFVTILTLSDKHCGYTYGDPSQPNFYFCGRERFKGCFCEHHAPFCFQPPQQQAARRRQDASAR